jgi:hypothetical protein
MAGLLPELLAGISPELEKYPQQLRLTMIPPLYGEAVQSRAWHVRELGGASPLANLMEVKA